MDDSDLLNTDEAAAILRVMPTTLEAWRRRGRGPRSIKMVRAVRYRRADLDAFLAQSTRTPNALGLRQRAPLTILGVVA